MVSQTHARSCAISLREVLPKSRIVTGGDIVVKSCSSDWRACRSGDVFFAITTAEDDGHEHVGRAVERGAAAIVAERLVPTSVPQAIVNDSRAAFGRVCQALAGNPSRELKTVGITGTAGKTVTAMLMASVLEAAGQAAGVMSSIGHSDSLAQQEPADQTPTAPEFASWLGRMSTAGCDAAVLELSSRALAERRAGGIELDAAVLTNVKSGNLGEHNSPRAYQQIIQRIFRMLKRGGLAVVNADDHRCRNLLTSLKKPCLRYGLHAEADVTAEVVERCASEQTFLLSAGHDSAPVRTRMIGDHHVSNCLAAAAVGLAMGIDLPAIASGLEAVERVPGRLERLECGQPFNVFLDCAATPETLTLAIKTLRQVTGGRVLTVFGPPRECESARAALIGHVVERGAHVPIITSQAAGVREPLEVAHAVLDGFVRPHKAHVIPDRQRAIRFALSQARAGDSVLIAGTRDCLLNGCRPNEGSSDREIALRWLYSHDTEQPSSPRLRIVG